MIVQAIFFYLFGCICVASAVMVIASKNPVHSVLFLILAFVNAAGLFVLMGAEFLAMILIVVYVGAVAVLFLFVVMMLDVDFSQLRQGLLQYLLVTTCATDRDSHFPADAVPSRPRHPQVPGAAADEQRGLPRHVLLPPQSHRFGLCLPSLPLQ